MYVYFGTVKLKEKNVSETDINSLWWDKKMKNRILSLHSTTDLEDMFYEL